MRARALSGGDVGASPLSVFEPSSPVVEYPVSPAAEEEYRSLPAFLHQRLQIEELTASAMETDREQQADSRTPPPRTTV